MRRKSLLNSAPSRKHGRSLGRKRNSNRPRRPRRLQVEQLDGRQEQQQIRRVMNVHIAQTNSVQNHRLVVRQPAPAVAQVLGLDRATGVPGHFLCRRSKSG